MRKIGVFDSGVGGLTVVKRIMKTMPYDDIVYIGDNQNCPYGTKSDEELESHVNSVLDSFEYFHLKCLVVACNTVSAKLLPKIKKRVGNMPVFGMIEAGAKMVAKSQKKRIGILATPKTIESRAYEMELMKYQMNVDIYPLACPEFVLAIEKGQECNELVQQKLKGLEGLELDGVILGCTHFPIIADAIKLYLRQIRLFDPAEELARDIAKCIKPNLIRSPEHQFFVTGQTEEFQQIARKVLEQYFPVHKIQKEGVKV